MGRQTGFFFGSADEQAFLDKAGRMDITFLNRDLVDEHESPYHDLGATASFGTSQSQVYMCAIESVDQVLYRPIANGRFRSLDPTPNPVIEYCRGGLERETNTLISGRIWYEHKYWDQDEEGNDVLVEKPERLLRLYNSLARWIRKYCTRLPDGMYIGPHALELHKKGAKLSP